MKKGMKLLFVFALSFSLFACGSKGASAEDTQKKIEKAGWEIVLERKAGTAVDYLTLNINDSEYFSMTRMIEDDSIGDVSYMDKSNSRITYSVSYIIEDKIDSLLAYSDDSIGCSYDLTNDKQFENDMFSHECDSDSIDEGKKAKDKRDKLLEQADITNADLGTWAKWYYENN